MNHFTRYCVMAILSALWLPASAQPPSKPGISMNQTRFEYGNDITVSWNLWWGTQGHSWELLNGGEVICSKDVAPVGQFPQTDSCTR